MGYADIVLCSADPKKYNFDFFYSISELKIEEIPKSELKKLKNKKVLINLKELKVEEGIIKTIAEKQKACFLIDLRRILKSKKIERSKQIKQIREFLSKCIKHNARYALVTFAEKEEDLRYKEEIENLGHIIGLNRGQARFALRMLPHYTKTQKA